MNRSVVLTAAALFGLMSGRGEGVVCGEGNVTPPGYVPVLVANGELAMTVDRTFGVRVNGSAHYSQGIFLEGRRVSHPNRELLPQGRWEKKLLVDGRPAGVPVRWEQRLDEKAGVVTCREEYPGVVVTGETFIPFRENTVAIRLTAEARAETTVTLGVTYEPPRHPRIVGAWQPATDVRRGWAYRSYGHRVLDGVTAVHGREETFALQPGESRSATFFVTFSDSMRVHPGAPKDYAALKSAHLAAWQAYGAESSVGLPEPALQKMWDMANYHLRINATPWSFPVGILNSHWQGLYFGFDEMYMHQGVLSSGHVDVARRVPDYRYATLGPALTRNRYGDNKRFVKYGARYFWESLEDGQSEGTVPGEWMDHIFHMATIAKCAWQQWLYGRDRAWFEQKGYAVLFECARYYLHNWVYEDSNGEAYIGKCCDLERLGPARERPFMTTCGVIYAFRAAAEASALLGRNVDEAEAFRTMADRLERSLPQKDGRYITCLNEPQESMATLAGFFPFPIFAPDHAPQREAVRHFIAEGRASGNMYPTGKRICPWYAGTMSAAASWMGDRAESVRWLREASSAAGLFGEYFEINEPGVVCHPWFSTAAGNCLYAINQMLLCDQGGVIRLAETVPEDWRDYAFALPSLQGVTVALAVRDGRLAQLDVKPRPGVVGTVRLRLRAELLDQAAFACPEDVVCTREGAFVTLAWPVGRSPLQLLVDRQAKAGSREITIPAGRYRVAPTAGRHLTLAGLTNVTVNATGVELVCTAYANALVVTNCANLTVKGLAVDYDPLPWTQGRVAAVDAKARTAELEIAEGYPCDDVLAFKNQYFDAATRELLDLPGAAWFERTGPRRLKAHWNANARLPPVGALFVSNVRHPVMATFLKGPDDYSRAIHAVVQVDSRETRFEDVTVWASPWFSFYERDCDATTYLRCRVDRRPAAEDPVRRGQARLRASNSDAFHCTRAARGPKVSHCIAKYMEDDGVNVHGLYDFIVSSDGAELRVLDQGGMNLSPGDAVELLDADGNLLPDAHVVAVRPDTPGEMTAAERAQLKRRNLRPYFRDHWQPKAYRVTLDRAVRLAFGSVIVSLEHAGRGFEVTDCTIGHTRARGVLVRARDGLVARNEIVNTFLPPVLLTSEPWWLEGGTPLGTVVKENVP